MLPEWMREIDYKYENKTFAKRRHSSFVRKSIRRLQKSLNEQMLTEHYAHKPGMLQEVAPGLKLVITLGLIILAGLTRNVGILLGLWVLTLVLMRCSHLPVLTLQARIWGFLPVIALLVALPGMFNIINNGVPLLMVYQGAHPFNWLGITLPASIFISKQGALAAFFLFLRTGISLSLGVLLVSTTPANRLFRSLYSLRVPALMVMIVEMSYRYLGLLINISLEMFEARSLRTIGNQSRRHQRMQLGSSVATLFNRSMIMAQEVYQAMAARGYTGELVEIKCRDELN